MAGPETPELMVDVVIPSEAGVVLIRRGSDPFEGRWALPGGFIEVGETVHQAAVREAAEETGLAKWKCHVSSASTQSPTATRAVTTSASPSWPASSAA